MSLAIPEFISSDFEYPILYKPASIPNDNIKPSGCQRLIIVTGFTDCERISTHMIKLSEGIKTHAYMPNIHVDIVLGMTKSSLSKKKHEDICRLLNHINHERSMPRVTCRYICKGNEVHTKLYVWGMSDIKGILPVKAYCGSLNYTMNAFYKRRELVSQCDHIKAYGYYKDIILPDTIDCFDPNVANELDNVINNNQEQAEMPESSDIEYAHYDAKEPCDVCRISLLTADGSGTGYGSGVNWGIRPNKTKRNPDQAYIPYNVRDRKPNFFPEKTSADEINCPMFRVLTKDYGSFHMRLAQQGNKAIQSVESNAIIGEWLRKKLEIPSGCFITKQMLEKYGKTYVTFRKYDDGTYLLDF